MPHNSCSSVRLVKYAASPCLPPNPQAQKLAAALAEEVHYTLDEKLRQAIITEDGYLAAEEVLGVKDLYDPRNPWAPYLINALRVRFVLFKGLAGSCVGTQLFALIINWCFCKEGQELRGARQRCASHTQVVLSHRIRLRTMSYFVFDVDCCTSATCYGL